jgi:hypothetical protein
MMDAPLTLFGLAACACLVVLGAALALLAKLAGRDRPPDPSARDAIREAEERRVIEEAYRDVDNEAWWGGPGE